MRFDLFKYLRGSLAGDGHSRQERNFCNRLILKTCLFALFAVSGGSRIILEESKTILIRCGFNF